MDAEEYGKGVVAGFRAMGEHDLYTDADKDRPEQICDRNGEVALMLCKRCGRGESELVEPCDARLAAQPDPAVCAIKSDGSCTCRKADFTYECAKYITPPRREPDPEPVAWVYELFDPLYRVVEFLPPSAFCDGWKSTPLYEHPPRRDPDPEPSYFGLTKDHLWMSISKEQYDSLEPTHRMECYAAPPRREPDPEPVAWRYRAWAGDAEYSLCTHDPAEFRDPQVVDVQPLYTAPPRREWASLTDDEIDGAMKLCIAVVGLRAGPDVLTAKQFLEHLRIVVRAGEAALKEKNNVHD